MLRYLLIKLDHYYSWVLACSTDDFNYCVCFRVSVFIIIVLSDILSRLLLSFVCLLYVALRHAHDTVK